MFMEPGSRVGARRWGLCEIDSKRRNTVLNKLPLPDRSPVVDEAPRCWRCNKKLANRAARPWNIDCRRCKAKNASAPVDNKAQ